MAVPNLDDVGFNDKDRSTFNRTSHDWCLYRDINYQGEWRLVAPEQGFNLTGDFDRSVSSLQPEPDTGC